MFFFKGYGDHQDLPSFPTRRSPVLRVREDVPEPLEPWQVARRQRHRERIQDDPVPAVHARPRELAREPRFEGDRKSTRLNSSHANISYAVFCLKKKKHNNLYPPPSL